MARKALTLSAEYTQLKRLGCSMLVYVSYSFTWEKDVKPRLKFKKNIKNHRSLSLRSTGAGNVAKSDFSYALP